MQADQVSVRFELRGPACLVSVAGELSAATVSEFSARMDRVMAAFPGPVMFDVSGLRFADRHGARALVAALRARPSRETGLRGCSPAVGRLLETLGYSPPPATIPVDDDSIDRSRRAAARPAAGDPRPGESGAVKANLRQLAADSGEVLSQLAATYADLALNSRYRTPQQSQDRGRLLALSSRARELSRQCLLYAASDAG